MFVFFKKVVLALLCVNASHHGVQFVRRSCRFVGLNGCVGTDQEKGLSPTFQAP